MNSMNNFQLTAVRAISAVALVVISGTAFGQIDVPWDPFSWVARYNGDGNGTDEANAVTTDAAGFVYVTGKAYEGPDRGFDMTTIKYAPNGTREWRARYDYAGDDLVGGDDIGHGIAVDSQGNVFVCGESQSRINGQVGYDVITVKYSPNGEALWPGGGSRFNNAGAGGNANPDDGALAIGLDTSGNPYVTGYASRGGQNGHTGNLWPSGFCTIKYNAANGVRSWERIRDGLGFGGDQANDISVDSDGSAYVTGWATRNASDPNPLDYMTLRYDTNGNEVWAAPSFYDGGLIPNAPDKAYALDIDASYVYVAGESTGNATSLDYAVVKYNKSNGALSATWPTVGFGVGVRRYNNSGVNGDDVAKDVKVDAAANVHVTGYSDAVVLDFGLIFDYATLKIDANGNFSATWPSVGAGVGVRRYNGPANGDDRAFALGLDSLGNTYVTGTSEGLGTNIEDYALVQYTVDGMQCRVVRYNGPAMPAEDSSPAVAIDSCRQVFITGFSEGVDQNQVESKDYASVKIPALDLPTSFQVIYGTLVGGALAQLKCSDDQYVIIEVPLISGNPVIAAEMNVSGTASCATPSALRFRLEAHTTGRPVTLVRQRIYLYNYQTGQWDQKHERDASATDSVADVTVVTSPSHYIQSGTRAMQAKITWIDNGVPTGNWQLLTDQAVWFLTKQ